MEDMVSVAKKQRSNKKVRPERRRTETVQAEMVRAEKPDAAAASRAKSVYGMSLNAETARQAVILSEIIGSPVSRRRREVRK